MMIRVEGVFRKGTAENQDVLRVMRVCAREREREERDLRTLKMRCVIWDNRMIFKMYPWSYKLKENIKREHVCIAYGYVSLHTNMPKLYFILQMPKGQKRRQANPMYSKCVCVQLLTCDKQKRDSVESVAFYDPTHFDSLAIAWGHKQCCFFIWQFKQNNSPLMESIVQRASVALCWSTETKTCQYPIDSAHC